jgi:dTDP-4-amino-4,6-dideoxygalactose transaminase
MRSFTAPHTFIATIEAITQVGGKIVFVDISLDTYNIAPLEIKDRITPKTKAIILVHLYGQPCEMDEIIKLAKENNLFVIEDCAQAIGAEDKGQKVGTFEDIGCFSFFPSKNLGA